MNWVITVPVWGDHYRNIFKRAALPSILAALRHAKLPARFIIATDFAADLPESLFHPWPVTYQHVPQGAKYKAFGRAHAAALQQANLGDFVCFLTADIVLSDECFDFCERQLDLGKRAVVCCGVRCVSKNETVPAGETAERLLTWACARIHPIIVECMWGSGRTRITSNIFFKSNNDILVHAFHLHPLAINKDRDISFGVTVDDDMLNCFTRDEIYIVANREIAVIEISPADKQMAMAAEPMNIERIVEWATRRTTPLHRWMFGHPIIIRGNPDPVMARIPVERILSRL